MILVDALYQDVFLEECRYNRGKYLPRRNASIMARNAADHFRTAIACVYDLSITPQGG